MEKIHLPIAVASRSFSKNQLLCEELLNIYDNVTFNSDGLALKGDQLIRFLKGHAKAIIALERLDQDVFAELPELKVVSKFGVGLDMIDLNAMERHGVLLGWIPGVNKRSVAELAVAQAINLRRGVLVASGDILSGRWQQVVGRNLSGSTVGIIGCGNVGKEVAILCSAYGCKVLVHDIINYEKFYKDYRVVATSLNDVLIRSDIVSLHVPLDDSTRNMINAKRLGLMKSDAILINTARGGIVDEYALKEALIGKRLAGAAFDVFEDEPPGNMELLRLPNFIATPHIGGSSEESILAMGRAAIEGLESADIVSRVLKR